MQQLQILKEDKEDYVILHVSGSGQSLNKQSEELNFIRDEFRELAKDGRTKILMDMAGVDYLSSSTIGAFLSGNSILKKIGGKLVMYNCSEYIENIFNVIQLGLVIPLCRNLEEAIEAVNQA
jgi:anti-anti-sigma factor